MEAIMNLRNKRHSLVVNKSFKIKNKAGHSITLPQGYKFVALTNSYQKNLVEMWALHCEADGNMLDEDTRIWDVPCEYVRFDEND
jgi:hypothetical protein